MSKCQAPSPTPCLKITKDAENVLNSPSPAATASLSIGAQIADAVFENLY